MKFCPYCGKQYADSIATCPVDHEPLEGAGYNAHSITGIWRGSYNYPQNPECDDVPFTLSVQQGALGHFTGTVIEDTALGMPGTGIIEGHVAFPRIEFVKRMPQCYMRATDGSRITLREWLAAQDLVCESDLPHPPVYYRGEFYGDREARGMWIIEPWEVPLAGGMSMPMRKVSGAWVMKLDPVKP